MKQNIIRGHHNLKSPHTGNLDKSAKLYTGIDLTDEFCTAACVLCKLLHAYETVKIGYRRQSSLKCVLLVLAWSASSL